MLKVLEEEKVDTEYATGVINWTKYGYLYQPERKAELLLMQRFSEEGARFPISMVRICSQI